jgi:hypothetical protein
LRNGRSDIGSTSVLPKLAKLLPKYPDINSIGLGAMIAFSSLLTAECGCGEALYAEALTDWAKGTDGASALQFHEYCLSAHRRKSRKAYLETDMTVAVAHLLQRKLEGSWPSTQDGSWTFS